MLPRRAFTLIELLIVICIIFILMGLLLGGVMVAKRIALTTKTVAAINDLAAAVEQYRGLNATYPERLLVPTAGDPAWGTAVSDAGAQDPWLGSASSGSDVYALAFAAGTNAAVPASACADRWGSINAALVYQLGSLISDKAKQGLMMDAYGKPLRYRPSKWYPFTAGASVRIDSDKPPNPDTFQVWSIGSDQVEGYGETGDDKANWQHAN